MRDWLNRNSAVVTIAAIVFLIAALAVLVLQYTGVGPTTAPVSTYKVYFWDLGKGEKFVDLESKTPPIPAPSGHGKEAVRAMMFACGDCSDPAKIKLGYLQSFTAAAKDTQEKLNSGAISDITLRGTAMDAVEAGRIVSAPSPIQWVGVGTYEASRIINGLQAQCGGAPVVKMCDPPQ